MATLSTAARSSASRSASPDPLVPPRQPSPKLAAAAPVRPGAVPPADLQGAPAATGRETCAHHVHNARAHLQSAYAGLATAETVVATEQQLLGVPVSQELVDIQQRAVDECRADLAYFEAAYQERFGCPCPAER